MTLHNRAYRFFSWLVIVFLTMTFITPVFAQSGGPVTFQYFYDDRGQLVKVVDSTGVVIEYVYDPAGNLLQITRSVVAGMAVFNLIPEQGSVGTSVTILGQQFGSILAENSVQFNGVHATVISATSTSLVVTVPPGATTGPVSVTVGGNTATSSNNFTVTLEPVITSISPDTAIGGYVIANALVTGFNLTGSTFIFAQGFLSTSVTVPTAVIAPTGLTATLSISISTEAHGVFVLVGTNASGSSSILPTAGNTLTVTSNLPGEVGGSAFSILNTANPTAPNLPGEADGPTFSVLNQSP